MLAETRRRAIEEHLNAAGSVSVAELEERFGVSPMTARRDLAELERRGVLRRTHGGAVANAPSVVEDSFARRLEVAVPEKRALAAAAAATIAPGSAVFLDSSTTSLFVAQRITELALEATVLTNSLPLLEHLFKEGGTRLEVIAIGGALRRLNRSFVGPVAVDDVRRHFADLAFFSIKAVGTAGTLIEADPLEAEVKRTMIAQAAEPVVLLDGSKLTARGLTKVVEIDGVARVLAAGIEPEDALRLRSLGGRVEVVASGEVGDST